MSSIKILDAAMGTEIISSGIKLPPYIWSAHTNIDNPDLVYKIHREHIKQGAEYITTNTFRATPRSYMKTGLSDTDATKVAYKSFLNAIKMAKKAKLNTNTKILGSIAPLEDCYTPSDYPGDEFAELEFLELSNWFMNCGVDIILLETMNNLQEIVSCLKVFSSSDIHIWLSLNLLDGNHILSGEKINNVVESISGYNVSSLLINCNSIEKTNLALDNINACWSGEWGIYPNVGLGEPASDGIISNFSSMKEFVEVSRKAVDLGATILGGCCGSNHQHIQILSKEFK